MGRDSHAEVPDGRSTTVLAYTLRFSPGGDKPFSQAILADSLGEAIDKAKSVTRLRPPHEDEVEARLTEGDADGFCLWSAPVEDVRAG